MEKEIISNKQGVTLIVMFIMGSSIIITPGTKTGKDAWIAILVAMVMIIPMLFVYARLLRIFPGKDLFDLQRLLFGKAIGSITSILFILFALHLGAMILRNFSEFIQAVSFPETPQLVTLILIGVVCISGAKCGIEVLARWSAFVFPILIFVLAFLFAFTIPASQLTNMRPILYNGFAPVISSSISILFYPFAEVMLFTMFFSSLNEKEKTFKIYLIGTVIAGLVLVLIAIRNILVLGAESIAYFYFPSHAAVSVINIANFFDRFEIVVAINFVLCGFIKATICLYSASRGFSKLFNVKNHAEFAAPLGIIMFITATFVYENMMEMFKWAEVVYKYYSMLFLIIMPVIILTFAEIKYRGQKRRKVEESKA